MISSFVRSRWNQYQALFLGQQRVKSFDGIRFFSILFVVMFHVIAKISNYNSDYTPFLMSIRGFTAFFFFSLFFASGFFISFILLKKQESKGQIDIKQFWLRRIFRTWPLYFMILGIYLYIYHLSPPQYEYEQRQSLIYYLTFTQNFNLDFFFPFSWTLAIEEQFYLVAPLLFLVSRRFGVIVTSVILSIVVIALRMHFDVKIFGVTNNTLIWCEGFLGGLIMAFSYTQNGFLHRFLLKKPSLSTALGTIAFTLIWLTQEYYIYLFPTVAFIATVVVFYPIISPQHFLNKVLSYNAFSFLSAITYSLYLVHDLAIQFVFYIFGHTVRSGLEILLLIIVCVSLALLMSSILFFLIEIPFFQLRKKYLS